VETESRSTLVEDNMIISRPELLVMVGAIAGITRFIWRNIVCDLPPDLVLNVLDQAKKRNDARLVELRKKNRSIKVNS
jgi:hypothetical protein